jgi:hypothetical protein
MGAPSVTVRCRELQCTSPAVAGPPPELIGQRDESNRQAPDKTRIVNNAGLLSCVFYVTKLPAKH